MGPLYFQQVLPMPWGGPIAFAAAAADHLTWAHWFFSRCCQCPRVGPLSLQLLLPMDLLWPIVYAAAAADGFIWAHCFSERCWPYPRVGPLQLCKQLPMASLGPIMFPAGAANALGRALLRRSALAMSIGSYYILYIVATKHC